MKYYLKWFGALPAAVISSILAFALGSLVGYLSTRMFVVGGDGRWMWASSRLIANILAGYVFVYVGATIAPKYKLQTSVFLVGFVLVLDTVGITLQLTFHFAIGFWNQVEVYVGSVLAFVGAIIGYETIKSEADKKEESLFVSETRIPKKNGLSASWKHVFGIGDKISLKMEEGDTCIGEITALDTTHKQYLVTFEEDVSLMPAEEPESGWIDKSYPQKTLRLSENDIMMIANRKLIGTTIHYHF